MTRTVKCSYFGPRWCETGWLRQGWGGKRWRPLNISSMISNSFYWFVYGVSWWTCLLTSMFFSVQISYAAASPLLSNRDKFPYFFRTYVSENLLNPSKIWIFSQFNWNRIATISEDHDLFTVVIIIMFCPPFFQSVKALYRCMFITSWKRYKRILTPAPHFDPINTRAYTDLPGVQFAYQSYILSRE